MIINDTYIVGGKVRYNYLFNESGKIKNTFIPNYVPISRETTLPQNGLLPNTLYVLDFTEETEVTLALASLISGIKNVYEVIFETGENAPTITYPEGISWKGGTTPTLAASKHYRLVIEESLAQIEEY